MTAPVVLTESAGPAASSASLSLLSHVLGGGVATECGTVRALLWCSADCSKPPGDKGRGVDKLASSSILRPNLGQEVIKVGGNKTSSLMQGCFGRSHDECHCQHSVRKVLGGKRDDKVAQLSVGVLLGIGVCEGQRKRAQEKDSA